MRHDPMLQDTLMGCRKFTLRSTFIEKDMVMQHLMWIPQWDGIIPRPAILKPKELWTGTCAVAHCIVAVTCGAFSSCMCFGTL